MTNAPEHPADLLGLDFLGLDFVGLNLGVTHPLAEPIVAHHVADRVVDRLVTAIALGLYVPGQRLPSERELAPALEVSRSTVRDALSRLTDAGFVEVRRGRHGGYFVLANWGPSSAERVRRYLIPNWAHFETLFDARNLLEPLIARTAAERRTASDCVAISAALDAYLAASSHDASRLADEQLHRAIAEAAHNAILLGLSTQLRSKVSLNLGAEPYTDQVRQIAIAEHRDLAAAVIAGQADVAGAIAARHFTLSENLIRELVHRVQHDTIDDQEAITLPGKEQK